MRRKPCLEWPGGGRTGNIYVASYTSDTTLPTTPGAFQTALKNPGTGNSYDGFIAKFNLTPSITPNGIVPNDSTATMIEAGEWVSIYGVNLAGASATWTGNFPISLGGISVTIDGKQAYLWYVSPTQINLQVPDDATTGPVTVVVTTPNGTVSSTVTLAQFAPAFNLLDTKHVAGIILRANGSGATAEAPTTSSVPRAARLVLRRLRRKRATRLSFSASDSDQPARMWPQARYSQGRLLPLTP